MRTTMADRGKPTVKNNGGNKEFMGRKGNTGMGAPVVSGKQKKGDSRSKSYMGPIKPSKSC